MKDRELEEHYLDVLQNLEFGIVQVARQTPDLLDAHVELALEALLRYYKAEMRGYEPQLPTLRSPIAEVFNGMYSMAEFRLGRSPLVDAADIPMPEQPEPLTAETIVACLKRIRKSVKFWSREGGRRGYLQYIDEFFPG